jgi:hypothetical protein
LLVEFIVLMSWQGKANDSTASFGRKGPNRSAMILDDRPANWQANAQSRRFRGEEGSKQQFPVVRGEARPMVAHFDPQHVGIVGVACADEQAALFRRAGLHRLDAILDQVHEHLLDLNRIGQERSIGSEIEDDANTGPLGFEAAEVGNLAHERR